jgi:hypothetical protein
VSKPGVDDIFDGELSFGSTPRVFLPRGITYPDAPATVSTSVRPNSKFHKMVDPRSKRMMVFEDNTAQDVMVLIKLPLPWFVTRQVLLKAKNKSAQGQKNPSRPHNKNKRNASSNVKVDSPDTAAPSVTEAASSKPQNNSVPGDKGAKTPLAENTVLANSSTETTGSRKTVWPKVPKGPRGRGRGSYRAQA